MPVEQVLAYSRPYLYNLGAQITNIIGFDAVKREGEQTAQVLYVSDFDSRHQSCVCVCVVQQAVVLIMASLFFFAHKLQWINAYTHTHIEAERTSQQPNTKSFEEKRREKQQNKKESSWRSKEKQYAPWCASHFFSHSFLITGSG
jgi:hypothetical protein